MSIWWPVRLVWTSMQPFCRQHSVALLYVHAMMMWSLRLTMVRLTILA